MAKLQEVKFKEYTIPVVWQCYGVMKIVANSLEEAEEKAIGEEPLPQGDYLDETIILDKKSDIYGQCEGIIDYIFVD